ncbi:threonine synthase [Neolewinella lacunae]|uniref:Threonine synthase n=1 Tax=Neolewinella lacunae TaxID=1517758 RepID=A0A923TA67_9BACT|nr:threonine synthase [Neolewinella lacunae]MBC6995833.1 threonine synthase [Neolewinella lacunae]MDN3636474.1 threonine synthase [Neolewinella lacunae]
MKFYSTNDPAHRADLPEALFRGLPADNGLYMPERLDPLPAAFFAELPDLSFQEIAYRISAHLLGDDVPAEDLKALVYDAVNFPAPVVKLDDQRYVLELFHGPSLAFKDFGARFMSRLMGHFNRGNERQLVILVATSGDTGGAVAAGFYQTPGIEVVILYPKGKVSLLQEKQLTTLGHNIHALEVDGTFDDCQAIVKKAFLDEQLRSDIRLSSANSINISRLIPQAFYYFEAYKQLGATGDPVVFCVPSGNFGNLTAGLLAQRMGLPVHHFLAATNRNDVVPAYLQTGVYQPRPSVATLSNAMDVGAPSNFARMLNLYGHLNGKDPHAPATHAAMQSLITGYAYDDAATEAAGREVEERFGYVIDPHGAVGYLALTEWQKEHPATRGVILETAHPSKFKPDVERILGHSIEVPERLAELEHREKVAIPLGTDYEPVRDWLRERFV